MTDAETIAKLTAERDEARAVAADLFRIYCCMAIIDLKTGTCIRNDVARYPHPGNEDATAYFQKLGWCQGIGTPFKEPGA